MSIHVPHWRTSHRPSVSVLQSLTLADGRRIGVRKWPGTGSQTIVFLHGLLDSSEGWAATCERRDGVDGRPTLTRIAFDIAGFGNSDAPSRGSIDLYAHDIAEGLALLGVDRFVLVGHSLGGAVAARLAELMPDRVESLLLLAPVGFGHIHLAEFAALPGLLQVISLGMPLALTNKLAVSLTYRLMISNGTTPEAEMLDRVLQAGHEVVLGAREAIRAIAEAGSRPDCFTRRRLNYHGPTIAIWGDRDRLVPPGHRHALQRALPQAEVEVWAGMGHHPQRERADDLLAVIRRVAGHDLRPPAQYVSAPVSA
ncbi:MAG TPA: alpha/beta fold hydrolase [Solirubrobacteraceae bacterium]|nr:alpha/beta fold hydrolase [Solirubrobacteraceae bacterium]